MLGGDEALSALVKAAKERGMRIMLDGVFSHTGADSVYFDKYSRYGEGGAYHLAQSPYRSWYDFNDRYPNGYRSWWGFPELPEVNEEDASYCAFVMGGEDSLLSRMAGKAVTSWRLDVADELPDAFITSLRGKLKALDADGVLLGEVWEDASNKVSYGEQRAYVLGNSLDSVMNYPFRAAVADFLLHKSDAYALNNALQDFAGALPEAVLLRGAQPSFHARYSTGAHNARRRAGSRRVDPFGAGSVCTAAGGMGAGKGKAHARGGVADGNARRPRHLLRG